MLFPELLNQEFARQREGFTRFDRKWRADVEYYVRALGQLDAAQARAARDLWAAAENCALPADEWERGGTFFAPFGLAWQTHEAARRWALEVLRERVTCAADGSQLNPGREVSLPVALLQVAWFENHHNAAGDYHKGARPLLLSPAELLDPVEGRVNPDTVISYRRFELETEALREFMERRRGWRARGERPPLAFLDGSLTYMLSFGGARTAVQDSYEDVTLRLLRLSRETEVSLVGYIDQSYSRDLVGLIDALRPSESAPNRYPFDAQLLSPFLKGWGDRTVFCHYRRAGLEDKLAGEGVGFTYLQTTAEGAPARLEMPAWIYEAGLLNEIIDTVRAECVVGLGYPYAIETADQAAVITSRDREIFLRATQEFATQSGLSFRVSRKLASKARRR
jgi:hypothetical protein